MRTWAPEGAEMRQGAPGGRGDVARRGTVRPGRPSSPSSSSPFVTIIIVAVVAAAAVVVAADVAIVVDGGLGCREPRAGGYSDPGAGNGGENTVTIRDPVVVGGAGALGQGRPWAGP